MRVRHADSSPHLMEGTVRSHHRYDNWIPAGNTEGKRAKRLQDQPAPTISLAIGRVCLNKDKRIRHQRPRAVC